MKDWQFDALARELGDGASRRRVLRLLGGAAALGAGLGLALGEADARKSGRNGKAQHNHLAAQKKGKGKGKGKTKKKKCKPSATHCCSDADCRSRCDGSVCLGGACDCFPGRIRHNGVCGNANAVFCQSVLTIVTDASECCSDAVIFDDGGQMRCAPGNFECLAPPDCADGGPCRGFMCSALYNATTGC